MKILKVFGFSFLMFSLGCSELFETHELLTTYTFQTFIPGTLKYGSVEEILLDTGGIELPEVTLEPLEELILLLTPRKSFSKS